MLFQFVLTVTMVTTVRRSASVVPPVTVTPSLVNVAVTLDGKGPHVRSCVQPGDSDLTVYTRANVTTVPDVTR